jgi:hypothetical protein
VTPASKTQGDSDISLKSHIFSVAGDFWRQHQKLYYIKIYKFSNQNTLGTGSGMGGDVTLLGSMF